MWWIEPTVVFARHYVSKYRKQCLVAVAAGALFSTGFVGGWVSNTVHQNEKKATEAVKIVERIKTEYIERDGVERTVYVRDLETTRKLEAERDRLRSENQDLQERLVQYVPQGSGPDGGYLSNGAVRLLNEAAAGRTASAGVPTGSPSETDLAASSVGWIDLARHTVRISGQYNDARLQCNALIDWVDENVVNKPQQ